MLFFLEICVDLQNKRFFRILWEERFQTSATSVYFLC